MTRLPRLSEPLARPILVPFDKRECISLKEAAGIAGKSESTMRAGLRSTDWGVVLGEGHGLSAGSRSPCSWMATIGRCGRTTPGIVAVI